MSENLLDELLRRLEQGILEALRDLPPPGRSAVADEVVTLLERVRYGPEAQTPALYMDIVALCTRAGLRLPEARVERGLTGEVRRGDGVVGRSTLAERAEVILRLVRSTYPAKPKQALAMLYPDAHAPRQVPIGQVFSVEAQVCAKPPLGSEKSLQAAPSPDGRVRVRVYLVVGEGIEMRSRAEAELMVEPGQDSHVVAFRVEAVQAGPVRGRVIFLAGTSSAEVELMILAVDTGVASGTVGNAAAMSVNGPAPAGLHLSVIRLSDVHGAPALRLELHEHGIFVGETDAVLSAALIDTVHRLVTTLGERFNPMQPAAAENTIHIFGSNLAVDLLKGLRDILQRSRPAGTRLFVQSTDAQLPIELCRLCIEGKPVFLGEHFAVSRGGFGPLPPATFRARPAVLLYRPKDNFDLVEEEDGLTAVAEEVQHSTTYLDIMQRLSGEAPIGILHAALHGEFDPHQPGSARLLLEGGELLPLFVPRSELDRQTPVDGGLVFLNACRAGAAQSLMTREGGLVDAFRKAGAAAVVAPIWSVKSGVAGCLAGRLYAALAAGSALDEALRQARCDLAGEPDRLAYVLYAGPGSRPR